MGMKKADLDVTISDVVGVKDGHSQDVQKLEAVDMDMGEKPRGYC
jgi:hypothetical protein